MGQAVFSDGLADPRQWTADASLTDVGCNWYLNRFVKLTFDWQRAMFGSPVLLNPDKNLYGLECDLFWLRCQLYF